jgi:hypothetical protein
MTYVSAHPIMRAAAVLIYRPSPNGFGGTGETGKFALNRKDSSELVLASVEVEGAGVVLVEDGAETPNDGLDDLLDIVVWNERLWTRLWVAGIWIWWGCEVPWAMRVRCWWWYSRESCRR